MIDPRLSERAQSLLRPMLAAVDGLLDEGFYGATWKDTKEPDLIVFLGHAHAGLVVLNTVTHQTMHWLRDRYIPQDTASPDTVHEYLVVTLANSWIMTSLPVYAQIVQDAAADNLLIYATPSFQGAAEALNKGIALQQARAPLPAGVTRDDDGTLRFAGGRGIAIPLSSITNTPEGIQAAIDKVLGEIQHDHDEGLHTHDKRFIHGGSAFERFGERLKDLDNHNAGAIVVALKTQMLIEEAINPLVLTEDGLYGAIPAGKTPNDCTQKDAHIHAMPVLEAGQILLHATDTDDYLGVPFLGEVLALAPSGEEEPYIYPIVRIEPDGAGETHGEAVCSIIVWPLVQAFAQTLGITIWIGECGEDSDDDEAPSPEPTPLDSVRT